MFHRESISSIVNVRALKIQPEHMTLSKQGGYKGLLTIRGYRKDLGITSSVDRARNCLANPR